MSHRGYLTALLILGLLLPASIASAKTYGSYDTISLTIFNDSGLKQTTIDVWIADTPKKRFFGLSGSDSLPEGKGMLFVYPGSRNRTFTMRKMNYGLDIVFIDTENRIKKITTLPPPAGKKPATVTGRGKYILEVLAGWTRRHSIREGFGIKSIKPR